VADLEGACGGGGPPPPQNAKAISIQKLINTSNPVNVNGQDVHCLMYADDIILLSKSAKGLQEKLDIVSKAFFKSTKHANNHPSFELQYLLISQLITNI
jgi:ketosteroid isomerase-like protein